MKFNIYEPFVFLFLYIFINYFVGTLLIEKRLSLIYAVNEAGIA